MREKASRLRVRSAACERRAIWSRRWREARDSSLAEHRVGHDAHHDVVQVMGDPAGELAEASIFCAWRSWASSDLRCVMSITMPRSDDDLAPVRPARCSR